MRPKTKRQEAIATGAMMMDRWNADQYTQRLRADPFGGVILQLGDIYTDLGEPFVTINPTTQERSFNLRLYPERQTKQGQRVQEPLLAMDDSAFIQGRQIAEVAAQRIVASWAKVGIPSIEVWGILDKITPRKKRFVAQLAREHGQIVSTIEAQKAACCQMARVVASQAGLLVFSSAARGQIEKATRSAVETRTKALQKLVKASEIIETAKREFVHIRNRARREAEIALMQLREKHVKERPSNRARITVALLKAFDPDTPWNVNSIRAGRAYHKP